MDHDGFNEEQSSPKRKAASPVEEPPTAAVHVSPGTPPSFVCC
jgi:hypothetical protein